MTGLDTFCDLATVLREHAAEVHHDDAIPTGFRDFDSHLGGLPRREVTIFAGPMAIGTSSLARSTVRNIALAGQSRVLLIEASDGFGAAIDWFRTCKQPNDPLQNGLFAGTVLLTRRLGQSSDEIVEQAATCAQAGFLPDLIVVDSLRDLAGVELKPKLGKRAVGQFVELAEKTNAALLVCAGLPSRKYGRARRHPCLSELRTYGTVMDHAAVAALLHRDGYFDAKADPNHAALSVYSHTLGKYWVELRWDRGRRLFSSP